MSGKTEVTPNITDDPPYPKPEEEKPVKPKREYHKYEMVRFKSSLKPSNEPFLLSCFSLVEEMYGDVTIKVSMPGKSGARGNTGGDADYPRTRNTSNDQCSSCCGGSDRDLCCVLQ
ncbi:hypothetical protein ACROYT_G029824 [Oculina patagonica]